MDAKTLYQQGIVAVRAGDKELGQRLLARSLQLEPDNAMAWLWLSRTQSDPRRQRQCVERALVIDPQNATARELKARLQQRGSEGVRRDPPVASGGVTGVAAVVGGAALVGAAASVNDPDDPFADVVPASAQRSRKPAPVSLPPPPEPPSLAEQKQIRRLLEEAEALAGQGRTDDALERWVQVLGIQVDNAFAMKFAVRTLTRLRYVDDATELVRRALDAGTRSLPIHLTALDLAKLTGDHRWLADLRQRVLLLPEAETPVILKVVDDLLAEDQTAPALRALTYALEKAPQDQALLVRMGDLQKRLGRPREAMRYYNDAARIDLRTPEGREADEKLTDFAPELTDRERGSVLLAWREAAAFGVFGLLLAWQDVGLNLANMTAERWLGVGLAVIGGYLLVTATSSPQQRGLARLLGGQPPDSVGAVGPNDEASRLPVVPLPLRVMLGVIGSLVLALAFYLVFNTAINLIVDPVPADLDQFYELLFG